MQIATNWTLLHLLCSWWDPLCLFRSKTCKYFPFSSEIEVELPDMLENQTSSHHSETHTNWRISPGPVWMTGLFDNLLTRIKVFMDGHHRSDCQWHEILAKIKYNYLLWIKLIGLFSLNDGSLENFERPSRSIVQSVCTVETWLIGSQWRNNKIMLSGDCTLITELLWMLYWISAKAPHTRL